MKIGPRHIPTALYKKILAVMPVACVDLVVVSGKKFLLGKRVNEPARGEWFLIGGRVLKGERLEGAARRHLKTELGIARATIQRQLGTGETIFKTSAQGPSSHGVNTVFLVRVPFRHYEAKNSENSNVAWFSKINPRWEKYVKDFLRAAGFK